MSFPFSILPARTACLPDEIPTRLTPLPLVSARTNSTSTLSLLREKRRSWRTVTPFHFLCQLPIGAPRASCSCSSVRTCTRLDQSRRLYSPEGGLRLYTLESGLDILREKVALRSTRRLTTGLQGLHLRINPVTVGALQVKLTPHRAVHFSR